MSVGGGDVAWYRFDEANGASATDSSGTGRNATITTVSSSVEPLYQIVTRDETTGDIVLKVVNAQENTVRTGVDLGPRRLSDTGTVTTLTAQARTDMNSFAEPTKVAPVDAEVTGLGNRFVYEFPASSITFIRLHDARAETVVTARAAPDSAAENTTANVVVRLTSDGQAGRATGTVSVTSSEGEVLGSGAVGRGNVVLIRVSAAQLGVGGHQLTVRYGGDAEFKPSDATVGLTVTTRPGHR